MNLASRSIARLRHGYLRLKTYIGRPRTVVQNKPVILSENPLCENPIFLVGVHRSGTSLCRRIINSHSNIACPPETYFLKYFAEMLKDEHIKAGFCGLGYDGTEVMRAELRHWASRYHEAYRLTSKKGRWADKTPQYIDILPEINAIFGAKTQYIMIFRHPLDVIYSIWSRGWRLSDYADDLLENTAKYVANALKKQIDFLNNNSEKCISLFYEDLIADPELQLKRICSFIGEEWEEEILEYHKFDHNFGTEDPIVRGTKGFVANSGNWKAFNSSQLAQIRPIIVDAAEELRYKI